MKVVNHVIIINVLGCTEILPKFTIFLNNTNLFIIIKIQFKYREVNIKTCIKCVRITSADEVKK